jgi:hypothetical protein
VIGNLVKAVTGYTLVTACGQLDVYQGPVREVIIKGAGFPLY